MQSGVGTTGLTPHLHFTYKESQAGGRPQPTRSSDSWPGEPPTAQSAFLDDSGAQRPIPGRGTEPRSFLRLDLCAPRPVCVSQQDLSLPV